MNTFNQNALEAKARTYIDRALQEPRDSALFAFWCHLALEPLARAAIAQVSPVLLADGRSGAAAASQAAAVGAQTGEAVRSAGLAHVMDLCQRVLSGFTGENLEAARRLAERRNSELHTGDAPFEQLTLSDWYTDFIRVMRVLMETLHQTLEDLLGTDEAMFAESELVEEDRAVTSAVKQAIGRARHRAETWSATERVARTEAARAAARAAGGHVHTVACPACEADAVVRGDVAVHGATRLDPDTNELYEPLVVVPTSFSCTACELRLDSRNELRAARVGDPFTVISEVDPLDFHGIDIAEAASQAGLYVVEESGMEYEDE